MGANMSIITNTKINVGCLNTFIKRKPIFAAWHVTYRCNLKCKFCDFWKNEVDLNKELSLEDFQKSIDTLLKLGIRVVNFAGGEPCIRKELPQIVKLFSKDFIVIINTNGTLITESYAKALWEAGTDIVNVSLDFFSEEKHNYYRGGTDTYQKAIQGVKILNNCKTKKMQKVAIQSILSPQNLNEIEDMVKLAEELKVDFTFNPYRFGEHELDMSFKNEDLSFLYELKKKYKSFIATKYALDKTIEFVKKGETGVCGMGKFMLAIDPYGNVGPCENMMQHNAGNILEDSYETIQSNLLDIYKKNQCNKCLTRERSEVEPLYINVLSPHWIKEAMLVKKS
jgi:MoaA/NifB/PqqE/SkfB family radical SAM enzyme